MRPDEPRLPGLFHAGEIRDVDEEIRHHIQECAELLIEQGWGREAALREAEQRFGAVSRFRAEMLAVHGEDGRGRPPRFEWIRAVGRDAHHALRALVKRPAFTLPVVLTLALGIGAAAAVFSVIDAAMLRPLEYRHPDRLMDVKPSGSGNSTGTLPIEALPDFLAGIRTFSDGWLAYRRETLVRTDGEVAEQLAVLGVTPGTDTLLGIPMWMGRSFTTEDALSGSPDVVILAREYYDRIGAEPSILGRTIRLESGPATVVGVLRGGVRYPTYASDPDLWVPLRTDFSMLDRTADASEMDLWIRLLPGLERDDATARASVLGAGLRDQGYLAADGDIALIGLADWRLDDGPRRSLWALGATVAVLLLIALVNGVNLLLVRSASRTRELAVRTAIGGSRMGILRLLLLEGIGLGLAGGMVAAALAWLGVGALAPLLPAELLFFSPHAFAVEARTLLFTLGAALLAGLVLGAVGGLPFLGPVGGASSLSGRPADDTVAVRRLRDGLVVTQIALSMALLAAAGLFVKSFATLVKVDPGFEFERVAFAMIPLSEVRYPDSSARNDFRLRIERALETRPEVEGVSFSNGGGFTFGALEAEGRTPPEDRFMIPRSSIAPDYLDVTGMELVSGRTFSPADAGTHAAIIDLDLARFLWGFESVAGQRFRIGPNEEWHTVVGVVSELQLMGRDERRGPNQILLPEDPARTRSMVHLAVRTRGDPADLLPIIQETLRAIDPEQWIWKLQTGAQALAEEEAQPRFLVTLMSVLAGVAVTLASIGLYGVLAYSVARRNRELGIRVALGADRSRVRRMVLGDGLTVAALGIVLGIGAALLATRALEQLLYEVEPGDPSTLMATAALFLMIAAAASLVPALRATRVDPVEVLRAE